MSKASEQLERVNAAILAADFRVDGETREETVRVGTTASPVFGGVGGEVRTFGGRARFARGAFRVTTGLRTTFVYRLEGSDVRPLERLSTREIVPSDLTSMLVHACEAFR